MERKSLTRTKKAEIVRYLFEHKNASKTELTKALSISMPTVLQATNELLEQGILVEVGDTRISAAWPAPFCPGMWME